MFSRTTLLSVPCGNSRSNTPMPLNSNPKHPTTTLNFQFKPLPSELQKAIHGIIWMVFGITHFAEVIQTFFIYLFFFLLLHHWNKTAHICITPPNQAQSNWLRLSWRSDTELSLRFPVTGYMQLVRQDQKSNSLLVLIVLFSSCFLSLYLW